MGFNLLFTKQAADDYYKLEKTPSLAKRLKAVREALGYLQLNSKHPGLNTHKYKTLVTHEDKDVFEAYAENHTPGAYRVFWHYGPGKKEIMIISIVPHP